jgi:hypothetical protein
MEEIRKLLEQISIINKKNAELLDATGGRFNMFKVCGVGRYENIHSAILAEFLNPNGSHGLKSELLKCFIGQVGNDFVKNNFDCENAQVSIESPTYDESLTYNGRIDILIKDRQNHVLVIENKIDVGDRPEQLKRYDGFVKRKYGEDNYQVFYLTLFGTNASEQSGGGVNYTIVSYETDIINWLEHCVPIAVHYPMVRETINQYINHLKQLTHQDMDTKNKEEVVDMILSDKKLIDSAHYVVTIWYRCCVKIQTNLADNIKHAAQELELKYEPDCDEILEVETSFSLFKDGWAENNYKILFWVEQKQGEEYKLHIGVHPISETDVQDKYNIREKLTNYLSNFNIENYTRYYGDSWAWYWCIELDRLNLFEIPEKLSYNVIKRIVEAIKTKLDAFER